MKEKIARWYDKGWWSDEAVRKAVKLLGSSLLQMTMKISLATNIRR